MEFQKNLKEIAGPRGDTLAKALEGMDLARFTGYPEWPNILRHAFQYLRTPEQGDRILRQWLPLLPRYLRVADVVLFYIVRPGVLFAPMSIEVHREWITQSVEIAIRSKDVSLLESLVYTLGKRIDQYASLRDLVDATCTSSPKLKNALKKTGVISSD